MFEQIKYYFEKWWWVLTGEEDMPPAPPPPPEPLPLKTGIQYDRIENDMKLFENAEYDCLYRYKTTEHCSHYRAVREEFKEIHGIYPEEAREMGY